MPYHEYASVHHSSNELLLTACVWTRLFWPSYCRYRLKISWKFSPPFFCKRCRSYTIWLTKRQANEEPTTMLTEQERRVCTAKSGDLFCSYIQQSVIDADLSCGVSTDSVRHDANINCARSERGVLCQNVFQQLRFDSEIFSNIAGNCSTFGVVITSNLCSSQRSALLEDFKRIAGCCIGNYMNDTYTMSYYYDTMVALDYRVWNWCGVSLPSTICETGPTINPPAGKLKSCTTLERIMREYTQQICLQDIDQPFIDALLSDTDCYQLNNSMVLSYVSSCSKTSDGSYCISFIPDQISTLPVQLARLHKSCASSNITCNQTCRNDIIQAKETLCCCVNFYNTSVFPVRSPSVLYTVWKTCGIESPGFFDSTLRLNNGATTSITGKNTWMVIITFLSLPVHLVIIM